MSWFSYSTSWRKPLPPICSSTFLTVLVFRFTTILTFSIFVSSEITGILSSPPTNSTLGGYPELFRMLTQYGYYQSHYDKKEGITREPAWFKERPIREAEINFINFIAASYRPLPTETLDLKRCSLSPFLDHTLSSINSMFEPRKLQNRNQKQDKDSKMREACSKLVKKYVTKKRCGLSDSYMTFPRLKLDRTIEYSIQDVDTDAHNSLNLLITIEQAFIVFKEVMTSNSHQVKRTDIAIKFVQNFVTKNGAPLNAVILSKVINDTYAEIIVDSNWALSVYSVDETEKFKVDKGLKIAFIHEIGHLLGLGHSNDPSSVMFPWFDDPDEHRNSKSPSAGEINEIKRLQEVHSSDEINGYELINENNRFFHNVAIIASSESNSEYTTDRCTTKIDTIGIQLDRILHVFSGTLFWKVYLRKMNDRIMGYARRERSNNFGDYGQWLGLPINLTRIDTVFEHKTGYVYIFANSVVYAFDGNLEIKKDSFNLTDIGLSKDLRIDASFRWPVNKMVYLISGDRYWELVEETSWETRKVKPDGRLTPLVKLSKVYPKPLSARWRGVPANIDDAFTYKNTTYFFKDNIFYEFNNTIMAVTKVYPIRDFLDLVLVEGSAGAFLKYHQLADIDVA